MSHRCNKVRKNVHIKCGWTLAHRRTLKAAVNFSCLSLLLSLTLILRFFFLIYWAKVPHTFEWKAPRHWIKHSFFSRGVGRSISRMWAREQAIAYKWPFVWFNVICANAGILINEFEFKFVASFSFVCCFRVSLGMITLCTSKCANDSVRQPNWFYLWLRWVGGEGDCANSLSNKLCVTKIPGKAVKMYKCRHNQ